MKLRWVDYAGYLIYFAFLGLAVFLGLRGTLWLVSICLSAGCFILWFIARWQLGDAFSIRPEARQLVRQGLYSKIRHPIYVFGTLAFLFLVLALQGWLGLFIWVLVILIQLRRATREERLMTEMFGEAYNNYRRQTWF
jgi:protein-S-isoprenylcysteine O-methyltransferase Ste14